MQKSFLMQLLQRYLTDNHVPRRRGRTWSVLDLGELAARLGSPVTYDRRGDVVFIEDFGRGLGNWTWSNAALGGGKAVMTCSYLSKDGRGSALLSGGNLPGLETQEIERLAAYPNLSPAPSLGLEIVFAFDDELSSLALGLEVYLGDGTGQRFRVRFDAVQSRLDYWDANGAWAELAAQAPALAYPNWNHLKLVVDPQDGRYLRVLFCEQEIDAQALLPESLLNAGGRRVRISLAGTSKAAANGFLWVDDVILTINE